MNNRHALSLWLLIPMAATSASDDEPTLGPLQMARVVIGALDQRLQRSPRTIANLPLDKALATLAGLEPVTYRYATEDEHHVGFIAETSRPRGDQGPQGVSADTAVKVVKSAEIDAQRRKLEDPTPAAKPVRARLREEAPKSD